MTKSLLLTALILAGFFAAGCGTYNYNVRVNGFSEPAAPALTPGSSFFVIENQQAKNPLLEKEVKEKIDKLLERLGYSLTPYNQAEYYLFFSYGIGGEGRTTTVVMPEYGPFLGYGLGPVHGTRSSYFFVAPFFAYYPYAGSVALYDRWLLINVIDGKYYREKGQFKTIWVGEARSTGASSDLRTVLNYLLLADFKKFGQNTGQAVSVDIGEHEPLVYGLTPPPK